MLILLTLNSLKERDFGLRDKMIETVAEGAKQRKKEDFLQVLSKHEKELGKPACRGEGKERTKSAAPVCWACRESNHRHEKCPNKDTVQGLQGK